MVEKEIYTYVIERADGHFYKILSDKQPEILLKILLRMYNRGKGGLSDWTPHINRSPIAIYKLEIKA
ncbi:hypothetical protein EB118_23185 [bacterium]|nr:hypothetical protein [bacterium]